MDLGSTEGMIGREVTSVRRFGPVEFRRLRDSGLSWGIRHEVYVGDAFIGMTWLDRHGGWEFKAMDPEYRSVQAEDLELLGHYVKQQARR